MCRHVIGSQPRESLERDSPWLLLLTLILALTERAGQLRSIEGGMDGESWSMSRVSGGGVGGGDGSGTVPLSSPRSWTTFR